jgi:hypothetical protein
MFSVSPSRLSRKAVCTVAVLIAAIAAVWIALAGSALATPTKSINAIDQTPDHTYQLGGNCVAGQAPGSGFSVDWNEDAGQTTVQAKVSGTLCLQKTTDTYRVALRYFYRDPHLPISADHVLIAEYTSVPFKGSGVGLNTTSVNLQGGRVISASIHHLHVVVQKQVGAAWQDQATVGVDYP